MSASHRCIFNRTNDLVEKSFSRGITSLSLHCLQNIYYYTGASGTSCETDYWLSPKKFRVGIMFTQMNSFYYL